LYVEDLKRGTNKDIGPKDIFEMGSKKKSAISNTYQLSLLISIEYSVTIILPTVAIILRP
jgi:hypothetical protein